MQDCQPDRENHREEVQETGPGNVLADGGCGRNLLYISEDQIVR